MLKFNTNKNLDTKGAVLVEAALVLIIFLAMVGAVMYWSLTLHYRHILSEAMTASMRRISANVNQAAYPNPTYSAAVLTTPGGTSSIGKQIADHMVNKRFIKDTSSVVVNSMQICKHNNFGDCRMRVSMSINNPCYLCIFLGISSVSIQVDSGIEDPCFRTTDFDTGMYERGCYDDSIPFCS